ncbi:MAG TPA: SDR family oxidoreductase [Labilithrix sp.]|nr:SDR family oxidoreductase [Labilithrix sp.]
MTEKIRTYQGSVSIITGGASGIGRAIGAELAKRGAGEIVIADLQTALAEEAAEEFRRAGSRATVVTLDVRDKAAVERMVADVQRTARRIDYVFNNAGTGVMGETHHLEERDWDLTIDVNLHGVVNVVRSVYPRLIAQGFGHLVNTASVAGLIGSPFLSVYVATKHAVVGLSKSMRIEAAPHGVRVTALCPGAIRTPILTGGAQGRSIYEMTDARKLSWWERFRPGDVNVFAKETMDLVAKNEGLIILPRHNRVGVTLFRMFPALEEIIGKKIHAKTLELYPEMKAPAARATSTTTESATSN